MTVVVDTGHTSTTGCAPGEPASGLAALRDAGYRVAVVQQFPAAVCRIDGVPADEPCRQMPPPNAYWSYWRGAPGGAWTYRSTGPASSRPAPGTVEGWAFGDGSPPTAPPPAITEAGEGSSASGSQASDATPTPGAAAASTVAGPVGAGVLVVLLGAAGWVARRRRQGQG